MRKILNKVPSRNPDLYSHVRWIRKLYIVNWFYEVISCGPERKIYERIMSLSRWNTFNSNDKSLQLLAIVWDALWSQTWVLNPAVCTTLRCTLWGWVPCSKTIYNYVSVNLMITKAGHLPFLVKHLKYEALSLPG